MSGPQRAAAGLGVGPLLEAAGRAAGQVRAGLGGAHPDLALAFASGIGDPHATGAALRRVGELLGGRVVIGCDAHGVLSGARGVEAEPAVAVWGATLPGARLRPFHLEVLPRGEELAVVGMPTREPDDVVALLLADPWSFPVDGFVGSSAGTLGTLPMVGGVASGADGPGASRLMLDGRLHNRGAVGVVLGGPVSVRTAVSQGCRAIGPPMTVTSAQGSVVAGLAGAPALDRARQVVAALPTEEQALAVRGLHLGVARDERVLGDETADFLVRTIVGADPDAGSLTIADVVPVGRTVRFHLRDADAAAQDLRVVLDAAVRGLTSPAAGALLFSCDARGRAMFTDAGFDAAVACAVLGTVDVAGFLAAGEIGPVGGRNHLHGFTTSMLVLPRQGPDGASEVVRLSGTGRLVPPLNDLDGELRGLLGE